MRTCPHASGGGGEAEPELESEDESEEEETVQCCECREHKPAAEFDHDQWELAEEGDDAICRTCEEEERRCEGEEQVDEYDSDGNRLGECGPGGADDY